MEEWNQRKLESLIKEQVEENLHLDYKNALALHDSKKKDIAKDVSAFANSDGGVLIYGISEYDENEKKQSHLPKEITPVNRTDHSKEWLEQIINSGISPKINGIRIIPVSLDSGANDVVYVVVVPKGDTAHQAVAEKRYYRRYNFQSIPMDDWEIKDIINRAHKTQVRISLRPRLKNSIVRSLLTTVGISSPIEFDVIAHNEGNKVIKYLDCFFYIDKLHEDLVLKPKLNKYTDHSQAGFSNEISRSIFIDEKEIVMSNERSAILPQTWRVIGKFMLHPKLVKDSPLTRMTISTDDHYVEDELPLGLERAAFND